MGAWIAGKDLKPDVIYSSPAVRTTETARIALAAAGITLPVIVDERLQELSQGPAEGRWRHEVYTPDLLDRIAIELKDFRLEGGESMNDVCGRGIEWWQEVRRARDAKVVFAFTHGYTIRCFVGSLLGWDHTAIRQNEVDNAAATRLTFGDDGGLIVQFNLSTQV